MQTYDFPFFSVETVFPDSSAKMQFGRGYEFVSKPKGPDQVQYNLAYEGMQYFVNGSGNADRLVNPTRNILTLEDFYRAHRLYEKFIFPHPVEGNVTVRFRSPLKYKQTPKGLGVIEPFTVELLLQP